MAAFLKQVAESPPEFKVQFAVDVAKAISALVIFVPDGGVNADGAF